MLALGSLQHLVLTTTPAPPGYTWRPIRATPPLPAVFFSRHSAWSTALISRFFVDLERLPLPPRQLTSANRPRPLHLTARRRPARSQDAVCPSHDRLFTLHARGGFPSIPAATSDHARETKHGHRSWSGDDRGGEVDVVGLLVTEETASRRDARFHFAEP